MYDRILVPVADTAVFAPLGSRGSEAAAARERQAESTADVFAERLTSLLEGSDAHARPIVGHGSPHRNIVDVADGRDCDLIVMATHGPTGIQYGLLGSVTERVLRTAETPPRTQS